jgi:hypothetical protein
MDSLEEYKAYYREALEMRKNPSISLFEWALVLVSLAVVLISYLITA